MATMKQKLAWMQDQHAFALEKIQEGTTPGVSAAIWWTLLKWNTLTASSDHREGAVYARPIGQWVTVAEHGRELTAAFRAQQAKRRPGGI